MSAPDPNLVRKAAAEFPVKRPVRFENLQPWKEVIGELREKRASCHTIADFLNQYGIQTSKSTVADFCKVVLHEPAKRKLRVKRAKPAPALKIQPAKPVKSADGSTSAAPPPNGKNCPPPPDAEPTTPGTRKRGPRIASIELIED